MNFQLLMIRVAVAISIALIHILVTMNISFSANCNDLDDERDKLICSKFNSNDDQEIDEDDLIEIFKRDEMKRELFSKVELGEFFIADREEYEEFLEDFALKIMIEAGPFNRESIQSSELKNFQNTKLPLPFKGKLIDFLPPIAGNPPKEKPFLDRFGEIVSIRGSFLNPKLIANPATITYSHFGDSDATQDKDADDHVFEVRGAISLSPNVIDNPLKLSRETSMNLWPVVVYEADISSDTNANRNSITHRIGFDSQIFQAICEPDCSETWGHNFILTADFVTDKKYEAEQFGGTFQWSPNARHLGIGRKKAISKVIFKKDKILGQRILGHWRPYLGITAAHVSDPGDNAILMKMSNYTNGFARVMGQLQIGDHIRITPEGTLTADLDNDVVVHFLFAISGRYSFDKRDRISFNVSYERGERGPDFVARDIAKVSLGIKF